MQKRFMRLLQLVQLTGLMERTEGSADVSIGLIDGPVATQHPDLAGDHVRAITGTMNAGCAQLDSLACRHGTFVAGILSAARSSPAPAICPGCTLLIRPVFAESSARNNGMPAATPGQLAAAISDCIAAGARVINLSLGLTQPSTQSDQALAETLDSAARRGVIVVAAAGNQGTLGTSTLTRHQWVIPVAACDGRGMPMDGSNLGNSIGRRGLRAPGHSVTSLGTTGETFTSGGSSAAAAFVTGAVGLLWSEFPAATATQIKLSITGAASSRRASVVPPLLDAATAHRILAASTVG
jgi:subtilisin family serine protease